MKKYVTPNAILVLLEYQDICTASTVNQNGNANFKDYDFNEDSWI